MKLRKLPSIDITSLDPAKKILIIKESLPRKIASFNVVTINVPAPRDEKANTGDKHMKFIPGHYLRVDYCPVRSLVINVPDHFVRRDFTIPNEGRCAVTRHFFVRPESLGKKIQASVEVMKNSNGTFSINIMEIVDQNVLHSEFKLSMRPRKEDDVENNFHFFLPTEKCLEFIPIKRAS